MDIQMATPPKRNNCFETPPKSRSNQMSEDFSTPPKNSHRFETPKVADYSTPLKQSPAPTKQMNLLSSGRPPKENPESRRQQQLSQRKSSPVCDQYEEYEVSMFTLSRLEQDYALIRQLGNGHFSHVGLYRSRLTNDPFAIKEAKANKMSINEVQALGSLWAQSEQSPHVVRYYHSWVEEGSLFLVMEYCEDNLQHLIERHRIANRPIEESIIRKMLKEALLGLDSLHKLSIIHLDVKPENLLLSNGVLKIADFGLCRAARLRQGDVEEGDSRYLAKEVLNYEPRIDLTRSDIFSLALTFLEMLTLHPLPNNGEQWLQLRDEGVQLLNNPNLRGYSRQLLELIEKMGNRSWEMRPSAAALLQQKYFKESPRMQSFISGNRSGRKRENSL